MLDNCCYFSEMDRLLSFKWIVLLSSYTHPHVNPNLHGCFLLCKRRYIFRKVSMFWGYLFIQRKSKKVGFFKISYFEIHIRKKLIQFWNKG